MGLRETWSAVGMQFGHRLAGSSMHDIPMKKESGILMRSYAGVDYMTSNFLGSVMSQCQIRKM